MTMVHILIFILFIHIISSFIIVLNHPRSIASTFAWIFALIFFPGIGFIFFQFFGRGIDGEIIYRYNEEDKKRIFEVNELINQHNQLFLPKKKKIDSELLKTYFRNMEESPVSRGNDLKFYTDGREKFTTLFQDIKEATDSIHVEYYAIFDDKLGNTFLNLLVQKALEGVEVCLLFDPWGGQTKMQFFKPLVQAGGRVLPFITSRNLIRKTRLNYHLHRKIVVIDGQIGWTGGFNIGDQYVECTKKFGYWRDTHARITGTATFSMQEIFIRDWNASAINSKDRLTYEHRYFILPRNETCYQPVTLQIVPDGPESPEQIIKGGFMKMILAAQERIWIQTPYLIPDDAMLNSLLIASRSGVDIRIMIPAKPDHPFIYRATQYYANVLQKNGIKIYIYSEKCFLHAKTMLMDTEIATFGTTNQDIRSYALNFEISAFVYSSHVVQQVAQQFEKDLEACEELTDEMIRSQSSWLRMKQNFSRLFSPIL